MSAFPRGGGGAPDDRAERRFVLLVWLAMSVALFWYVLSFGRDLPYQDDWEWVPLLAGQRAFDLDWLFGQTMEHRYILVRALLYPVWLLGGHDFRAPMLVDAALLSATAWLALRTARGLRGRAAFSDACLPLLLLHFGHHESLIFFVQMYFIVPCCLALWLLSRLLLQPHASVREAVLTGLLVMLLPLNGAMGLLWSAPFAAWLLLAAWWRRERHDGVAAVFAAAALLTVVEAAWYFVGLTFPEVAAAKYPRTPRAVLATTLEMWSIAFGPSSAAWPAAGALLAATAGGVALCLVVSGLRGSRLLRNLALLAALASGMLITLAIGWGRSRFGPGAGAGSRYALLLAPMMCALYYAAVLAGARAFGRGAQTLMLCLACVALAPNTSSGLAYARQRSDLADAVARDARAGTPASILAQRYSPPLYPDEETLRRRLAMLLAARLGPYRTAVVQQPEPRCHAEPFAIAPGTVHHMVAEKGGWRALSDDPFLVFELGQSKRLCGVHLVYRVERPDGSPAVTQVFWADRARGQTHVETERALTWVSRAQQDKTVWIHDTVDNFRFDPDNRSSWLRIDAIELLLEE